MVSMVLVRWLPAPLKARAVMVPTSKNTRFAGCRNASRVKVPELSLSSILFYHCYLICVYICPMVHPLVCHSLFFPDNHTPSTYDLVNTSTSHFSSIYVLLMTY